MIEFIRYAMLAVFVIGAAYQDIKGRKIRNQWNVGGAVAGVLMAALSAQITAGEAFLGMITAFAISYVCWMLHVFHAGDAKLFTAIGAFLGRKMFLNCFVEAVIIGSIVGIVLLLYKKAVKKEQGRVNMPFAPIIAIACLTALTFGYIWELLPQF